MEGEESLVDEEKLTFINQAGQDYATVNCSTKDGEEREKCVEVRGSLQGFAMSMLDVRGRLKKCEEMAGEGLYTSPGNAGFTSCLSEVEILVKSLIDEHYEKLSGLGYSPSS